MLAIAGLTACASTDDGVATLTGPTETAGAATDPDAIAGFVDCLVAGGVPATIGEGDSVDFPEASQVTVGSGGPDGTLVEIDGQDVSAVWADCEQQYPGVEPFGDFDDSSPEAVAAMNRAGSQWADCARENGHQDIPDPQDGAVQLPPSLTAERAAALGEACSIEDFDPFGIAVDDLDDEAASTLLDALLGAGGQVGTFSSEQG